MCVELKHTFQPSLEASLKRWSKLKSKVRPIHPPLLCLSSARMRDGGSGLSQGGQKTFSPSLNLYSHPVYCSRGTRKSDCLHKIQLLYLLPLPPVFSSLLWQFICPRWQATRNRGVLSRPTELMRRKLPVWGSASILKDTHTPSPSSYPTTNAVTLYG